VKILKKKYKSVKTTPEEFILQQQSSGAAGNKINDIKPDTLIPAKNFYDVEENKIKIPNQSENFTGTNSFYNIPKEKKPIGKQKNQPTKKILIEEIKSPKNAKKIVIKKTILNDNTMEVKFDLSEFEENDLEILDIDLQLAKNGIKLSIENMERGIDYEPIEMTFNFNLDLDKIDSAVFNKLNNSLIIKLIKL
jgi:hypothetical protein